MEPKVNKEENKEGLTNRNGGPNALKFSIMLKNASMGVLVR